MSTYRVPDKIFLKKGFSPFQDEGIRGGRLTPVVVFGYKLPPDPMGGGLVIDAMNLAFI